MLALPSPGLWGRERKVARRCCHPDVRLGRRAGRARGPPLAPASPTLCWLSSRLPLSVFGGADSVPPERPRLANAPKDIYKVNNRFKLLPWGLDKGRRKHPGTANS